MARQAAPKKATSSRRTPKGSQLRISLRANDVFTFGAVDRWKIFAPKLSCLFQRLAVATVVSAPLCCQDPDLNLLPYRPPPKGLASNRNNKFV